MPTLTPAAFANKWRGVTTTEKASAQSHFIDLCRMLGEPTPHDADPTGGNPPLLIVSDLDRIDIRTNFRGCSTAFGGWMEGRET